MSLKLCTRTPKACSLFLNLAIVISVSNVPLREVSPRISVALRLRLTLPYHSIFSSALYAMTAHASTSFMRIHIFSSLPALLILSLA